MPLAPGTPSYLNGEVPNRKGQLLVASRQLRDPNFARAVVLIVQHDDSGAVGLVLNRPLDVSVAEAVGGEVLAAAEVEKPVHQGGPCPGPLMVLHADAIAGGDEVLPGVRFTAQRDEIESLMRSGADPAKYFANYSGWGAEQLENELAEGAWITGEASAAEVFSDDETLWTKLMTRLTLGRWIDSNRIPDDPSVN